MSTIETSYTEEEIREFASRPFVIGTLFNYHDVDTPYLFQRATYSWRTYNGNTDNFIYTSVQLNNYYNDGTRKIGLINGVHDDGSLNVTILGTGKIYREDTSKAKYVSTSICANVAMGGMSLVTPQNVVLDKSTLLGTEWTPSYAGMNDKHVKLSAQVNGNGGHGAGSGISYETAVDYHPAWQPRGGYGSNWDSERFLLYFSYLAGQLLNTTNKRTSDIPLTTNKNTSLTIGHLYNQYQFSPKASAFYTNGYANIGGALYAIANSYALNMINYLDGMTIDTDNYGPGLLTPTEVGTYACHYTPFNLILTRNEEEALNYIENDVMPSDAFIYPFDVDNIPTNTSGENPEYNPDEGDGSEPSEDGTPTDNCNPMPSDAPSYTPQSLTNNNLYWLSAADLKQFIDWFWTDATDIASLGDLWDKITGLYENLAQSIISIRYMPINISWIGGTAAETKIIVGMIEKEHVCASIVKSAAPIRTIGHIKISTLFNGSFANYTPYSSIQLYLPFHGMVELDNDLIMNHEIYVKVAYDILSGTIQYFVHRDTVNGSLVYTTVAKMAVDIPITLQTKTDRDSAIFSNVSNVTAGLIGAGASIATGNPIGLTMGLANVASFTPTSAPMSVKGNVGETGAFYSFPKCAIYIKRPAYNRPSNYAERVGYPANITKKLSSCSGFTTCYMPRISFKGNDYTENQTTVTIKPTKEEEEEIYSLLEKGVII